MNYWLPRFDGLDLLVFRVGGPGLGNLLLTWAKCHVRAELQGGRVIRPTWAQLKIGPILRRESDLRWYGNLFRASPYELTGRERIRALSRLPRTEVPNPTRPSIVEVRGIAGLFSELVGHHELIEKRLLAITHPSILKRTSRKELPALAVHVRLGDFSVPPASTHTMPSVGNGPLNTRIPLTWYREVILQIRSRLDRELPILVFSDGADSELASLLELPGIERRRSTDALSDLLEMRSCSALIASGSTYSMWASFLGQMPTVWYPGQMRHRFIAEACAEVEYSGDEPLPDRFLACVERRSAQSAL